jgi:hypothetical protein
MLLSKLPAPLSTATKDLNSRHTDIKILRIDTIINMRIIHVNINHQLYHFYFDVFHCQISTNEIHMSVPIKELSLYIVHEIHMVFIVYKVLFLATLIINHTLLTRKCNTKQC